MQIKKYKNIYFDLDQTLWDFRASSRITLLELSEEFFPVEIPNPEEFLSIYYPINDKLWVQYRKGELKKEGLRIKRFKDSLVEFGIINNLIIEQFCSRYLEKAPKQQMLLPHTHEVLTYLKNSNYRLFLLTNGFVEVQKIKIKANNLEQYFERMITSDEIGYQKPNRKIFEFALKTVNAKKRESILIGDDVDTDIAGALNFGMDCIFLNSERKKHNVKSTYEINSLKELPEIL